VVHRLLIKQPRFEDARLEVLTGAVKTLIRKR
jgi:hypothetical protein